jgi:FimV-like protein
MLIRLFKKLRNFFKISKKEKATTHQNTTIITSRDIRAIAGENIMATQLDLARAYIEIGKKTLAKKILNHVVKNGNTEDQKYAKQLLVHL